MFERLKGEKIIWKDPWFSGPLIFWTGLGIGLFFLNLYLWSSPHLSTIAGGVVGGAGHLVSLGRVHQSMNPRIYRGILLDPVYATLVGWSVCTLMQRVRVDWLMPSPIDNVTLFALAAVTGLFADALIDHLQRRFEE